MKRCLSFYYMAILVSSLCILSVRSATITGTHDVLNRFTKAAYGDGSAEAYSYDAAGNRPTRISVAAASPTDFMPQLAPINPVAHDFATTQFSFIALNLLSVAITFARLGIFRYDGQNR